MASQVQTYDYLIVGSGLFGATFAYHAKLANKKVLVIDKRDHNGGNVYCENIEGINVHKYGAHIFHTNSDEIWAFVNQFCKFNNYINSPVAKYGGKLYNLPFNMNTFYQIWGVTTPDEAKKKIEEERAKDFSSNPRNLEEQAISMVGREIYEKLIRGYTAKQWDRDPKELPASIIRRLPLRFTFDNNYFNDKYQGIPIGGYNKIFDGLLDGIEVKTGVNFFENRSHWESIAKKIVYTGKIDEFFDYKFGPLDYRSLKFDTKVVDSSNYQGNAVVNYTEQSIPYTRIIEHKHFEFGEQEKSVITYEYPMKGTPDSEPYYPVNDDSNMEKFNKYKELSAGLGEKVILGGRLAEYKYYDMHQVIGSAIHKAKNELGLS